MARPPKTHGNSEWNAVAHPTPPEGIPPHEAAAIFARVGMYQLRMHQRGLRPQYLEVTHAQGVALLNYLGYPPRTYAAHLHDIKNGSFKWGHLYVAFGPLLRVSAPRRAVAA